MHIVRRVVLCTPAALVLTACSSTEPNAMRHVSLSAAVASAGARPATGTSADLIITGDGESVKVTSAQMVLSRIKLANNQSCGAPSASNRSATDDDEPGDTTDVDDNEPGDTTDVDDDHEQGDTADVDNDHEQGDTTDVDDDHEQGDTTDVDDDNEAGDTLDVDDDGPDGSGCAPLQTAPVQVAPPLDGTTKIILDALVPAGTYTRLQAKLNTVEVVGVFTDANGDHPFTFTSRMYSVSAINFDTPVTVDASSTNLTINIDVGSWFKSGSGALIDPTSSANQKLIEHNIRRSFRAF